MSRQGFVAGVLAVIALCAVVLGAYLLIIRPWQLRWGATDEELARPMPADDLVLAPTFRATRAVTIEGTPEEIWPWLVQMGYGRAGFYAYDLIENIGSPRGIRSADRIIPELQHLKVGDEMPISAAASQVIHAMEPPRFVVWADGSVPPTSAFTWGLYPIDRSRTRLISRIRFRHHWTEPWILMDLFTDFADHVAVRKVLLGVRDRVEGRTESMARQNAEIALWAVASLELMAAVVLIFIRRPWWRGWLLALAAAAVLLVTLYAHPPPWMGGVLVVAVLGGAIWTAKARGK